MIFGVFAGITWALETVVLGIALSMTPFVSTKQAIFLAPFVSTFLHDFFSAIWACLYNGVRGNLKNVWAALKTKSGKAVMLAAVIGGPVGMTGYVLAIKYLGSAVGAVANGRGIAERAIDERRHIYKHSGHSTVDAKRRVGSGGGGGHSR